MYFEQEEQGEKQEIRSFPEMILDRMIENRWQFEEAVQRLMEAEVRNGEADKGICY